MRTIAVRNWTWTQPAFVLVLLGAGCKGQAGPVYQDGQGFRFSPPAGWVERARDDAPPSRLHKVPDLPLPAVDLRRKHSERLLVEYQRLKVGQHAWLRVTVADAPASIEEYLSAKAPGPHWTKEQEAEKFDLLGLPAFRIAFRGRWNERDYASETVAVQKKQKLYVVTTSFPRSDHGAREQVRQAIAHASW